MRHLDEGTVHAWLDGALSAGESDGIEAHVAECGACAEMVAEARGLIAGASRILTGLDHVPSGVIPGGASAAPAAPIRPVRRWASRPALRAAAALLFVAGASVVVLRSTNIDDVGVQRAFDSAVPVASEAAPVLPPALVAEPQAEQEAPADLAGAGASANVAEKSTAPTSQVQLDEVAIVRDSSARAPGVMAPPPAVAKAPRRRELADSTAGVQGKVTGERVGFAPLPTPAPPAPGQDAARRAAGVPAAGAIGRAAGRAADSVAAERRRADSIGAQRAQAEELRRAPNLQSIVVTGTAGALPDTTLRLQQAEARLRADYLAGAQAQPFGNPGVEMAGCYAITIGPWSDARGAATPAAVPSVLRLDPTMLGIERDGPRLILRAPSDTAAFRADSSYWRVSARDSLLVVWRATTPETTLRLAIRDPRLEGVARSGDRSAPVTARRVGAACDGQRN